MQAQKYNNKTPSFNDDTRLIFQTLKTFTLGAKLI